MSKISCCDPVDYEFRQLDSLSLLLKIVGDKSRLQILCILRQGEHCVCEILDHLNMSQSLVSHHLRDLKDAGIVKSKKDGLNVHYKLTPKGKNVVNNIFELKGVSK
jgi:ArsR family transcriptional regulator